MLFVVDPGAGRHRSATFLAGELQAIVASASSGTFSLSIGTVLLHPDRGVGQVRRAT
jgi:hypothetical protein